MAPCGSPGSFAKPASLSWAGDWPWGAGAAVSVFACVEVVFSPAASAVALRGVLFAAVWESVVPESSPPATRREDERHGGGGEQRRCEDAAAVVVRRRRGGPWGGRAAAAEASDRA